MRAFGAFELDGTEKTLWRVDDGRRRCVPLRPKAFDLLDHLSLRPQRLAGHDEILSALWPDVHVQPEVLKSQILLVRQALDDRQPPFRYIEAIRGRGYRFIADVRSTRADAPPPTGRSGALATLHAALDLAARGKTQIVFLAGTTGQGRTAVLDAFVSQIGRRCGLIRGTAFPGEGLEPFLPLRDGLRDLARGGEARAVKGLIDRVAPRWRPGVQTHWIPEYEQLGPTLVREARDLVEALAEDRPLALLLDDLHWADAGTMGLIAALSAQRGRRLLLVASHAVGDGDETLIARMHRRLVTGQAATEILLRPLQPPDVATLIADRGGLPTPVLVDTVFRQSGGHPRWIAAILDGLTASDVLGSDPTSPTWPAAASRRLAALADEVLEALDARDRDLVLAAAMLDRPTTAQVLSQAAGLDPIVAEDRLVRLARQEIFECSNNAGEPHYALWIGALGQVLRDEQGPLRRARHALRMSPPTAWHAAE